MKLFFTDSINLNKGGEMKRYTTLEGTLKHVFLLCSSLIEPRCNYYDAAVCSIRFSSGSSRLNIA